MTSNAWFYFWVACFIVATAGFAIIWFLVLIHGFADLRAMIRAFRHER